MNKALYHKKTLISMLENVKDSRVLDYGCGKGDFIELMLKRVDKPKHIYAVDSSSEMIDTIKIRFSEEIKSDFVFARKTSTPKDLKGQKFDKIICHNVLECLQDKIQFINEFDDLLAVEGIFLLSHHDFDSAIFNSNQKQLTRDLIHFFSDTQQSWQEYCDGQMGRKISGLIQQSVFSKLANYQTIRVVEREFNPGNYGYLMAKMICSIAQSQFEKENLDLWYKDLEAQYGRNQYYFAIDLVTASIRKS